MQRMKLTFAIFISGANTASFTMFKVPVIEHITKQKIVPGNVWLSDFSC